MCFKKTCVKYYDALNKHMPKILGEDFEAKVIFSGDNNDLPHLKKHFTTKTKQENLINRFKQPINKDKLCFLIVEDILVTALMLQLSKLCIQIDHLRNIHSLTIARVNRTCTRSRGKFRK